MTLAAQLAHGDTRLLSGLRSQSNRAHVTSESWGLDATLVIRGIEFTEVLFDRLEFRADFPECKFTKCEFVDIKSKGHFWAADNRWKECVFRRLSLRGPIAPFNKFIECAFYDCELVGASLYHTTFRHCRFDNLKLRGLHVDHSRNNRTPFWQQTPSPYNVVFQSCRFVRPCFDKCDFANVKFQGTEVSDPMIEYSTFKGALGEPEWWAATDDHDPFMGFLNEVVAASRSTLGPDSRATQALESFLLEYLNDPSNKDYSAGLYDGSVPDEELDKLTPLLDSLEEDLLC